MYEVLYHWFTSALWKILCPLGAYPQKSIGKAIGSVTSAQLPQQFHLGNVTEDLDMSARRLGGVNLGHCPERSGVPCLTDYGT